MNAQADTLEQAYSLEQFVADTRRSLKAKPGPEGVEEVRQHLEQLLRNPHLLRDHLGDSPASLAARRTDASTPDDRGERRALRLVRAVALLVRWSGNFGSSRAFLRVMAVR